MSWTNELYEVYKLLNDPERITKQAPGSTVMLPVSHSTANAQIEVTIDDDGEFVEAAQVSKDDAVTVIPVTESSGARSSGIAPMPLADKLVYIAGDYSAYADGKRTNNAEYYSSYMAQLRDWCESEYSNTAVRAIYEYLNKGELMADLVGSGILEIDENSGKLTQKKISGILQQDAFVRFIFSGTDGICRTWKSSDIQESFIKHNDRTMGSKGLCYATGEEGAVTYKHPAKIRNSGDKAKLISSNDEGGFTYRGRFSGKEEAISVGYDYSQKIHNALKWLIDNQRVTRTDDKGRTVIFNPLSFDSLTLIVWNSALGFVPNVVQSAFEQFNGEAEEYDSNSEFSKLLHKNLMGKRVSLGNNKIMLMGLDAATTGRLSIAMYTELAESKFYENLEKWHNGTTWRRFNGRFKQNIFDSCSLPGIANCLYGTEQGGRLECDKKILRDTILRLLPCVAEGRRLPRDIVPMLYSKASNPPAYEYEYDHRIVLENACAMIRKEYHDYGKGEIEMAYDPGCTDRSYLYGCLLAIADKAESDTYDADEKRVTNARRLWNAFSARPCQTWQLIEERLEPYLEKEQWIMTRYTKLINEIMEKMSPEDFADNSKLSPMYLIGYHHYNALLWTKRSDKNEEE